MTPSLPEQKCETCGSETILQIGDEPPQIQHYQSCTPLAQTHSGEVKRFKAVVSEHTLQSVGLSQHVLNCVLASDYDALAQRVAELEGRIDLALERLDQTYQERDTALSRVGMLEATLALAHEFISYPSTPNRNYAKEERWTRLQASFASKEGG